MILKECYWRELYITVTGKKVICTPQTTYPTLVKEIFAIYYVDIDNLESSRKNQTWVREKWIRFTLAIIDRYYGFYHTYIDPLL